MAIIATGETEEELPTHREGKVNGGKARVVSMTPKQRKDLPEPGRQTAELDALTD